ncbi:MAG: YkgJ family cysteine cluster protein [Planctomycetes bacterium]|nr:YkgJ family cysteine cluster protein [Planctomycetota bacterium]
MPPPLELPTIQNWSCHNCGGCCQQHLIEITEAERQRIVEQHWETDAEVSRGRPWLVRLGWWPWSRRYRLGHQPNGACVFLDEQGYCRIHAKFGEEAKPLACRIYPYAFHPAGKKITVGLRFSCPSVAGNRGRPVSEQRHELKVLERLVVPESAAEMVPPPVTPGQSLDWSETLQIVASLERQIAEGTGGIVPRVIQALAFVELLGQARFDKIRGPRLREFLEIVAGAAASEAAALPEQPEPSAVGRMQFRLQCAQYARRDTLADCELGWANRWRLFRAAVRFTRGMGLAPPLQPAFVPVPFTELEPAFGPLPAAVDELLIRYLRVKIQSLHFCGRAYYDVPVVEGFQSLALVIPVVLFLARWLAVGAGRRQLTLDDVTRALNIADHHHGYSPAFGQLNFRARVRMLAQTQDISRLTAWYGR